jgi:polyhydroxyalkanoate synthesis repressor PhaR
MLEKTPGAEAARRPMADKIQLKKYSNRRLYDPENSSFVTLGQVAEMVREGRQVEVVDVDTKEDVTSYILLQIVLEEAKKNSSLLPLSLLYLIIRYGETLSEFFDKYLELTFKNYLAYKTSVDEQFKKWLSLGMDFSTMAQKSLENLYSFNPVAGLDKSPKPPPEEKEPEE